MQGKMSSLSKQDRESFMEASINLMRSILTLNPIDLSNQKTKFSVHFPNPVYISTVANPALHKASNSTNEKSDYQPRLISGPQKTNAVNKLHEYDFDFKNDDEGLEVL